MLWPPVSNQQYLLLLYTELLVLIKWHCHWFQVTPHVQLKLKVWMQVMRALRRARQKGEPISLKFWCLHNLISNTLELLQSEESHIVVSEVEQKRKREDIKARICQ